VSLFIFWVAVPFAFVALYILSAGPVTKYACVPRTPPPNGLRVTYAPLIWLCANSRSFEKFMNWYAENVWGVYDRWSISLRNSGVRLVPVLAMHEDKSETHLREGEQPAPPLTGARVPARP
jgi:hypothetical protein